MSYPLQHFFEKNELLALREAFEFDENSEAKFLEGWSIFSVVKFIKIYFKGLDLNEISSEKVIKYATKEYLGTQIRTYENEKPVTVVVTASGRVKNIFQIIILKDYLKYFYPMKHSRSQSKTLCSG